jgi:hypothetical protein
MIRIAQVAVVVLGVFVFGMANAQTGRRKTLLRSKNGGRISKQAMGRRVRSEEALLEVA